MRPEILDQVRALYGTTPDDFVATRNTLVTQLKEIDEREAATIVATLRRPSWIDGALGRAVRQDPDRVAAFAEAAIEARRIQDDATAGRRTGSLPDALRTLRTALTELAAATDRALAELGRKRDLAGVTARLGEIAGDPTALALLRLGAPGLDEPQLVAAIVDTEPEARTARRDDDVVDPVESSDAVARRQTIDAARRTLATAEREAGVAETAARRAADRRDRAAAAVESADEAVRAATVVLEQALAALTEHSRRAAEARRAADVAIEAAVAAGDALTDLGG